MRLLTWASWPACWVSAPYTKSSGQSLPRKADVQAGLWLRRQLHCQPPRSFLVVKGRLPFPHLHVCGRGQYSLLVGQGSRWACCAHAELLSMSDCTM